MKQIYSARDEVDAEMETKRSTKLSANLEYYGSSWAQTVAPLADKTTWPSRISLGEPGSVCTSQRRPRMGMLEVESRGNNERRLIKLLSRADEEKPGGVITSYMPVE